MFKHKFGQKMGWALFWVTFFTNSSDVDVMTTIFCDFCQFLAKELASFSKTNVMITFLHNLVLV
jgi:hypothetical protein